MSSQQRPDHEPGRGDTLVEPTVETKKPSLYQVLLLNDDYTPMEFVVMVLEQFFRKDREEATQIMLHVHQNGIGVCGVYTFEVAESKVTQVVNCAREHEHPLCGAPWRRSERSRDAIEQSREEPPQRDRAGAQTPP